MQTKNLGKLNIIVAVYGLQAVTEQVSNLITDGTPQTLNFTVNNKIIGLDGWRGQIKSLTVVYNYDDGDLRVATAKEGDILSINPDTIPQVKFIHHDPSVNRNGLTVLAASYGLDDVTYKIRQMISSYNTLSFKVDNTVFGDAWYGVAKTLVIVLGYDDEVRAVEIFTERERCYIDLNDVIPAV
jgi:hypothetical protein